jgi:hypothetical protein
MKTVSYRGYTLAPSSYQDSDVPGHWFPLVVVSGGNLTGPTNVALPPVRGLDEQQANEQAMRVAVQRIQRNDL